MGREQYSLVLNECMVSRDHQGKQGVHPQEVWMIREGSTQSLPVFVPFGIKYLSAEQGLRRGDLHYIA
jgi:hypothetical protein